MCGVFFPVREHSSAVSLCALLCAIFFPIASFNLFVTLLLVCSSESRLLSRYGWQRQHQRYSTGVSIYLPKYQTDTPIICTYDIPCSLFFIFWFNKMYSSQQPPHQQEIKEAFFIYFIRFIYMTSQRPAWEWE